MEVGLEGRRDLGREGCGQGRAYQLSLSFPSSPAPSKATARKHSCVLLSVPQVFISPPYVHPLHTS